MRVALAIAVAALTAFPGSGVAAADEAPYQINAIVSLTGAIAFAGQAQAKTLSILEGVVNRQGGIRGRPVKIVFSDDQSNPLVAVQLASRFAEMNVPVIFGPGN